MSILFDMQRRLGVVFVPDGTILYNNKPVIGIAPGFAGVPMANNMLVRGVDVVAGPGIYNEMPVRGAVLITDGRLLYNNQRVIPTDYLAVDLLQSILSPNGEDYAYFDFGTQDRLVRSSTANTLVTVPVDATGEAVALVVDRSKQGSRSLADVMASEPNVYDKSAAVLTQGSGRTVSVGSDGSIQFTGSGGNAIANIPFPTAIGSSYIVVYDKDNSAGLNASLGSAPGGGSIGSFVPPVGVSTAFFTATSATTYLSFSSNSGGACSISGLSIQQVPAHLAAQGPVSASRPTWQGPGVLFDGTDDYLTPDWKAKAGGNCIIFHADVPASMAAAQLVSSIFSSSANFGIGFQPTGQLIGQLGTASGSAIFDGTGADNRGKTVVGALVADGTTVRLHLNGALVFTGAQSGNPSTSLSPLIGASVANGSPGSFFGGVIRRIAYGQVAPKTAQIVSLSQKWASS
jgi:hypothetical protein